MRYKKIKYDGATVELRWHTGNNNGTVTHHEQESTERPAPAFKDALYAFLAPVEKMLGIHSDAMDQAHGVSYFDMVSGVSTSVEEDDERGIVVTLRKVIEVAGEKLVFVANTPSMIVRGEFEKLLAEAEDQAERFGLGAREQTDMFVDQDRRSEAEKQESDDEFAAAVKRGEIAVSVVSAERDEITGDDTLAGAIAKAKKHQAKKTAATGGKKR